MRAQRLTIGLTILNLLLVISVVAASSLRLPGAATAATPQRVSREAPTEVPVLRARALEIVDERGRIRSRVNVEADGEVVLRLIDRNGAIRVKLGAGEGGSGLMLADEATEPAVHIIARRTGTPTRPTTTSVTLRAGSQQHVIKP